MTDIELLSRCRYTGVLDRNKKVFFKKKNNVTLPNVRLNENHCLRHVLFHGRYTPLT